MSNQYRPRSKKPAAILPDTWEGWHITADTLSDPDGNTFTRDQLRAAWLTWQQASAYRLQIVKLAAMVAALMASRPSCSRPWPRHRPAAPPGPVQLDLIPQAQKSRL
jgi:hypothetical protein